MIIFVRPSKNASHVLQKYFCIIFQKEQRVSYLNKEKREGEGERELLSIVHASEVGSTTLVSLLEFI